MSRKDPEFKRPNHADFMDSSELKKIEFSGVRTNNLIQQVEIWILGEVVASMRMQEAAAFPERFEALYARTFALEEVKMGEATNAPRSNIIH